MTQTETGSPSTGGPTDRSRPRRRVGRIVLIAAAVVLLPLLLIGGCAALLVNSVTSGIRAIPGAFDIPQDQRPAPPSPDPQGQTGLTFLLAGTDRRSEGLTTGSKATADSWLPGQQRSDAIMLVHLRADNSGAYVVSIPRDSWVDIPGYGMNKINAAFSFGGPALYVQTVEQLTGLRMDHLAVIDWTGLIDLVDTLGGVELTFDEPTVGRDRSWPAGTHTLSGAEVLDYVGERYRLPRGDFDRVERQQNVLRALAAQLISSGVVSDPGQLLDVVRAGTTVVSVDDQFGTRQMVDLALRVKDLDPADVTYLTVPTAGTGMEGGQSVVYLDRAKLPGFFKAVRNDTLERWVVRTGARTTPDSVN